MKKSKLLIPTIIALFFLAGCGQQSQSDTEEVVEDTTASVETEEQPEQLASPLEKISGKIGPVNVAMQYGSPGVKGREVWGDLVPYGEVWRTGANEATWISFSQDVMVNGEKLPAGKYALFTVPTENEWTVIFNEKWDAWGAYDYSADEDVLKVTVQPKETDDMKERMTFTIDDNVNFYWENLMFSLNVEPASA